MATLYLYDQSGRPSGTIEHVAGSPLPNRFARTAPSPSLSFPVWNGATWVEAGEPASAPTVPLNTRLSILIRRKAWYWMLEKYGFYSVLETIISEQEDSEIRAQLRSLVFGADFYSYIDVQQMIGTYSDLLPSSILGLTSSQKQDMWLAAVLYQEQN